MQNRRGIILLVLAMALGLTATLATRSFLQKSGPKEIETLPVATTRLEVPIGTALTERHLKTVAWPKDHMPEGAISDLSKVRGRVVRRPLAAGEPVLELSLLPEGSDGGLPAVIEDKRRAVSVKVDPVIGVAGFVEPGSHVDVLVTLRRIDSKPPLPYSKIVLQDIPVLAIDQKLEEAENGDPELVSVVTLEVNPEQSEKLIYAAHEGKLQLALRSAADKEVVKTKPVGVADLLGARHRKKARSACACGASTVQVVNGTSVGTKSFCLPCPSSKSSKAIGG